MRESMNTQSDHAHMSIRIYIENHQSGSGDIPKQWSIMRYQEMRLVHKWWTQNIAHMPVNRALNHHMSQFNQTDFKKKHLIM